MAHAPGPWFFKIDGKDIYIGGEGHANYYDAFARVDYDDVDHEEAEATARLIAAAPDLLNALESAVGAMEVLGHPADYGALRKARRAIALAKGDAA